MTRIIAVSLLITLVCMTAGVAEESWSQFSNKYAISKMVAQGDFLWCIAREGIVRYNLNDSSDTLFEMGDRRPDDIVFNIAVGSNGIVWAVFYDNRIKYYDGDAWRELVCPGVGDDTRIRGLFPASDGSVWFPVMGKGLYRYADGEWSEYFDADGMSLKNGADMKECDDGSIWFNIYNEGFAHFKDGEWTSVAQPDDTGYHDFAIGDNNTLWVASFDEVMYRLDGFTWTQYGEIDEEKLSGVNFYNTILVAEMTLGRILRRENAYYDKNSKYFEFGFGEDCSEINLTIPEDTKFEYSFDGELIKARELVDIEGDGDTKDGFTLSLDRDQSVLEGSSFEWMDESGVDHEYAGWITPGPDGYIYAIAKRGIRRFDGSSWSYPENAGLRADQYRSMVISSNGTLYVGGRNGIQCLKLQ